VSTPLLRVGLADPDPQTLAAVADRHGVADRRSDALALIHDVSTIDGQLAVVGTLQTAKLQGPQSGLQIWTDQQLQCPDRSLWPQLDGRVYGALQAQLKDFLACVRQGVPSAVASFSDAVEGLRVAEALIESARLETTVQLGS